MLRRIGFDRFIKLDWLNKTVEIYMEEGESKRTRLSLDRYLGDCIKGRSKDTTKNVLSRTWVNVEPYHSAVRDRAVELFKDTDTEEQIALHWCMLMLAYPVFCDITSTAGKLIKLQGGFSLGMVRRRIYEMWGERTTLQYAIDRILRSVAEWGAVEDGVVKGEYQKEEQFIIQNTDVKLLLIEAYLLASGNNYLQFTEVGNIDELFPFKLDLSLDDFQRSTVFDINKMGSDIVIGL